MARLRESSVVSTLTAKTSPTSRFGSTTSPSCCSSFDPTSHYTPRVQSSICSA